MERGAAGANDFPLLNMRPSGCMLILACVLKQPICNPPPLVLTWQVGCTTTIATPRQRSGTVPGEALNTLGSPLWYLMLSRPLMAEESRTLVLGLVGAAFVVAWEVEEAVKLVGEARQVLEMGDRVVKGKFRCFFCIYILRDRVCTRNCDVLYCVCDGVCIALCRLEDASDLGDWRKVLDPESGRHYFYNRHTLQSVRGASLVIHCPRIPTRHCIHPKLQL
jgi:hypothetical protein